MESLNGSNNSFTLIYKMAQSVIEAIFPTRCLVCRCYFHPDQKISSAHRLDLVFARYYCPECRSELIPIQSPVCSICGKWFKSRTGNDHVCQNCITQPPFFAKARSAGIYRSSLKKGIHLYKYSDKIQLARPFGRLLFDLYHQHFAQDHIDIIMPVPLHWKRFRKRGFNQAYLLVKPWPQINHSKGLWQDFPLISKNTLTRNKPTRPQTGLKRKERLSNIKGAFNVRNKDHMTGKKILLIDDVFTTGATANECARTLIQSGAESVALLTLARAV